MVCVTLSLSRFASTAAMPSCCASSSPTHIVAALITAGAAKTRGAGERPYMTKPSCWPIVPGHRAQERRICHEMKLNQIVGPNTPNVSAKLTLPGRLWIGLEYPWWAD
jgi:hypothetical protein